MIDIRFVEKKGYTANSLSYRAPEFDTVDWCNSYVIQGCSAVFGLGTIEDDQITNYYLSQMLNAPVINLGVPGAGMEIQYLNAVEMLENGIKPKGVFIVYPSMDRYALYNNGNIENVGPWSGPNKISWMLDNNSRQHNLNLMRGYRLMWKLAGIPLYEWSHHTNNEDFCKDVISWGSYLDYGTDGQHWGPITSQAVAEILFNQFQESTTKAVC